MATTTKYMGYTPVKDNEQVEIRIGSDETWRLAKVVFALASQFTVQLQLDKHHQVLFYKYEDKGLTWRPVKRKS